MYDNLFKGMIPVFACKCGHVTCDPIESDFGYYYCPVEDCDEELTHPTYRDARYVSIAVYEVTQAYGGPEEGGWWYDTGSLVAGTQRSFLEEDAPQAGIYKEAMLHRYKNDDKIRWRDDVRYQVRVWYEEPAPAGFPHRRPRYS